MIDGITYRESFIANPNDLFDHLKMKVNWDERMSARKTASFGVAYNYSQMSYPFQAFLDELTPLIQGIAKTMNYQPNNCLINYYLDGNSKMGYHSDQTDILVKDTGVGIVSIGETRILRFRNIKNPELKIDYKLQSGSFIHMSDEVQEKWQHSIPKSNTENGRMSLTFRNIKV